MKIGANIYVIFPMPLFAGERKIKTKQVFFRAVVFTKFISFYDFGIFLTKSFEMLEEFKLSKVPETVFCIPDFVSEQEEENTLRNINKAPKVKWTNLLNRRLQNWGGLPKEKV